MIVLEASALPAYLFAETGHEVVADAIDFCCLSSVNLAGVLSRFARDGHDPDRVLQQIAGSGIGIVPFVGEDAALVAGMVPLTQKFDPSSGDRACPALTMRRYLATMTADRLSSQLDLPISVKDVTPELAT